MSKLSLRHRHHAWAIASALSALAILLVPVLLFAHAVVYPRTSAPGAYERYVLRVPNEKATATTRVEIRFPAGVRVTSFEDVPGWTLEVLTDSAKHVVGAVWTGSLPPQRFAEFPFMAANPKSATSVAWPAYQTYADGQRVEWTGEEGAKTPASVTKIAKTGGWAGGSWVPWTALVLAVIAVGLAARPSATQPGSSAPTALG